MSKSCILFACTILSEDRLHVLQEFLQEFKTNFSDCDIYVGVNAPSVDRVEDLINSTGLSIKGIRRSTQEQYTQSDASAYQVALELLNESSDVYTNCWFVHTKGGVNSYSDYLRKWYIDNLLHNRSGVEHTLQTNLEVGSYGMLGLEFDRSKQYQETDTDIQLFDDTPSETLPYTHANFFYLHTIYVVKYEVVQKFLSLISPNWFTARLDRYYFEGIFPFIVSRLGYFPYIENNRTMNGLCIDTLNAAWIAENKLTNLSQYLGKSLKDYNYEQLTPPYANSNT